MQRPAPSYSKCIIIFRTVETYFSLIGKHFTETIFQPAAFTLHQENAALLPCSGGTSIRAVRKNCPLSSEFGTFRRSTTKTVQRNTNKPVHKTILS
jgi:hypothetical protein